MAAMAPGPRDPVKDRGLYYPSPSQIQPRPGPSGLPSLSSSSLSSPCSALALPPSWSTLAGGVLSSGAGAEVGNGGPETANSWMWLVLSRGPSPEGNSIGSFHRVGSGSWGLSAAKSKLDSRAQVVCGEGCQLSPPDHLAGKFTPSLGKHPHVTQNTY